MKIKKVEEGLRREGGHPETASGTGDAPGGVPEHVDARRVRALAADRQGGRQEPNAVRPGQARGRGSRTLYVPARHAAEVTESIELWKRVRQGLKELSAAARDAYANAFAGPRGAERSGRPRGAGAKGGGGRASRAKSSRASKSASTRAGAQASRRRKCRTSRRR